MQLFSIKDTQCHLDFYYNSPIYKHPCAQHIMDGAAIWTFRVY